MSNLKEMYDNALIELDSLTSDIRRESINPDFNREPFNKSIHEVAGTVDECLMLGIAEDEAPLLVPLDNVEHNYMLVVDNEETSREWLETIAKSTKHLCSNDVDYTIISEYAEDTWDVYGVYPSYTRDAENKILEIAAWAHHRSFKEPDKIKVLLIQNIEETISGMSDAVISNLKWLLRKERNFRVVILATSSYKNQDAPLFSNYFGVKMQGEAQGSFFDLQLKEVHNLREGEALFTEDGELMKFFIPSRN